MILKFTEASITVCTWPTLSRSHKTHVRDRRTSTWVSRFQHEERIHDVVDTIKRCHDVEACKNEFKKSTNLKFIITQHKINIKLKVK